MQITFYLKTNEKTYLCRILTDLSTCYELFYHFTPLFYIPMLRCYLIDMENITVIHRDISCFSCVCGVLHIVSKNILHIHMCTYFNNY